MFALLLTLTAALALLIWGELSTARDGGATRTDPAQDDLAIEGIEPLHDVLARSESISAKPQAIIEDEDALMAQINAFLNDDILDSAELSALCEDETDLPHIAGYTAGDRIELEIEGPAPAARDIRFEPQGHNTRVLLWNEPALVLENVAAAALSPAIFRFRNATAQAA